MLEGWRRLVISKLFLYDFNNLFYRLVKPAFLYFAYSVQNDLIVCGEESVWPYVAFLI
jgi:hypothetical protein